MGTYQPLEHLFRDRDDAGARLAVRLAAWRGQDPVVLGIPRGGVPVAARVASALGADLDVIVARKIGAPGQPELAIGAIAADGSCYLNEPLIKNLGVSETYLEVATEQQSREAKRRETWLRSARRPIPLHDRVVILVDDGLATGATMRAAIMAVRRQRPRRLVVAVPVGAAGTCQALRSEADEVVAVDEPADLVAVGYYYHRFEPVGDDEVKELLDNHRPAGAVW